MSEQGLPNEPAVPDGSVVGAGAAVKSTEAAPLPLTNMAASSILAASAASEPPVQVAAVGSHVKIEPKAAVRKKDSVLSVPVVAEDAPAKKRARASTSTGRGGRGCGK